MHILLSRLAGTLASCGLRDASGCPAGREKPDGGRRNGVTYWAVSGWTMGCGNWGTMWQKINCRSRNLNGGQLKQTNGDDE